MKLTVIFPRKVARVAIVLGLIFAGVQVARAQIDTGSILGTVRDQAGAVVPGAKVTLTNEGTGALATMVSRVDGSYVFTPVRIGSYAVTAEVRGFETARQVHIEVNIQQQIAVDFSLRPPPPTETLKRTAPPR